MNSVLTAPSPPKSAELTEGRHLASDGPPQPAAKRSRAVDYGWRFWVCAHGLDGATQTTAVWGLWLDGSVAFAADTESVAAGDPREFTASIVQAQRDGRITIVDGHVERVADPATLMRFVRACEAKYGFELDDDPDVPVFVLRPNADIGLEADDLAETLALQSIESAA
jgi:hypothetical protein